MNGTLNYLPGEPISPGAQTAEEITLLLGPDLLKALLLGFQHCQERKRNQTAPCVVKT